jgi:prepilin-type N-terminal cleavage/methylation domain-containing protein
MITSTDPASSKGKARAFTLVEVTIVLAIIATSLSCALYYQQRAMQTKLANETTQAIMAMAGKIRTHFGPARSFAGFSANMVATMGIAVMPFSAQDAGSGATVIDPWGNDASAGYSGGTMGFTLSVGGTAGRIDPESCIAIASAFARAARQIQVGSTPSVSNGTLTSASSPTLGVFKNAEGNTDMTELAKGCSQPHPSIVLEFG